MAHKTSCQSQEGSVRVPPPAPCVSRIPLFSWWVMCAHRLPARAAVPLIWWPCWWMPSILPTSANYQDFSLGCSLVSKTDCSLVNHQNNDNNVLAWNNPSKCLEGCGNWRVISLCQRLLLKTKKRENKGCRSGDRNTEIQWQGWVAICTAIFNVCPESIVIHNSCHFLFFILFL